MRAFGKILILGVSGYSFSNETSRVYSVGWDELNKVKNLRDYDVLILDLFTAPPSGQWQRLYELLNAEVMVDILCSGEILVLGDPRFQVETSLHGGGKIRRPFLEWTAMQFSWHNEHGDTVEVNDDYEIRDYGPYLKHLNSWEYALNGIRLNREQLGLALNLSAREGFGAQIVPGKTTIARNRYSKDLAFLLKLVLEQPSGYHSDESGPVIFLPKTDLSEQETLLLLLSGL